ncbi:MAG: BtrH N-terminal domain-containing protein [Deltaproteobacteria bacterium]
MRQIIKNWAHTPGVHCGSTAIRDVMAYHGCPMSEAMCFGLGAGLGFYYTRRADISPTRMIFLRGPEMETSFFSLVDKPTVWNYEDDDAAALEIVKDFINRGVPVLIQTDVFYLDYYKSNTNFPGHVVSVWGYDDEAQIAYLADTQFEGLQAVSYDKFKRGRSSKAPSNPLRNNWFEVNPQTPIKPLGEIIPEAIRLGARKMIEGRVGARGESGVGMIKLWAEDLPNWLGAQDWRWCARFGYQVIARRGVCGCGFRRLYSDFLAEAEGIAPVVREFGLYRKMDAIASKWAAMAQVLKSISEGDPSRQALCGASSLAAQIWELETDFYAAAQSVP